MKMYNIQAFINIYIASFTTISPLKVETHVCPFQVGNTHLVTEDEMEMEVGQSLTIQRWEPTFDSREV